MNVEVVTPEESMGDIIGDLNKRRGQISGMESKGTARVVKLRCHFRDVWLCNSVAYNLFGTCYFINGVLTLREVPAGIC